MAFKPSYNIMDRDTHNTLVNAFKTGGIAYTDDDGTVHKIADDYINASGGSDLPEVTSADEGKVLAVNSSGEWAAERQGLIHLTDSGIDVSANQLKAMLDNGVLPYFIGVEDAPPYYGYQVYHLVALNSGDEGYFADFIFNQDSDYNYSFVALTADENMGL